MGNPPGTFGAEGTGEFPGLPPALPGFEGAPGAGLPQLSGGADLPNLPLESGNPLPSILKQP